MEGFNHRRQTRFIHSSLRAYFAAEYIAERPDPLILVKPFLWQKDKRGFLRWQPAAAEMICFLGGSLPNPEPLLGHLLSEDLKWPDHFGTMVQLAGRVLAEVRPPYDSGELAQVTVDSLMDLRYRLRPDLRGELIPALRSPLATAALIQRFRDHYSDALAYALSRIGSKAAVSALIQKLWEIEYSDEVASSLDPLSSLLGKSREHWDDYKHEMWRRVAQALERADGEPELSTLIRLTKEHPSAVVRSCAARKLASMGGQEAMLTLAELLQRDPIPGVRQSIALAMGETMCGTANSALIRVLREDSDTSVREATAKALGLAGKRAAIPALLEQIGIAPESEVWEESIMAVARIDKDPTASEFFVNLMIRNMEPKNHRAVAKTLWYVDAPVPASDLIGLMCEDPDPQVRGRAALALGRSRDKRHAGILLERAQEDPDRTVRRKAIEALGLFGEESVIPLLVEYLRNDSDGDVRFSIAEALAGMGSKEAVPFLLERIFSGRYADVGRKSVWVLEQTVGQTEAVKLVWEKAQMSQRYDRRVLVWALRQIGGDTATDALIKIVRHNSYLRWEAVKALGEMRSKAAVPILIETALLDNSLSTRWNAISGLGLVGSETAVPILTKLLQDGPDLATLDQKPSLPNIALVRQLAAEALGQICAETSVEALMQAIHNDPDPKVRNAAEKALANIYHLTARWFPVIHRA